MVEIASWVYLGIIGLWLMGSISMFLNFMNMGMFEKANFPIMIFKLITIISWPITFIASNLLSAFFPSIISDQVDSFMNAKKEVEPILDKSHLEETLKQYDEDLKDAEILVFKTIDETNNKAFHFQIMTEDCYLQEKNNG